MAASAPDAELDREMLSDTEHIQQFEDPAAFPAVIVEQVPQTHLLSYADLCETQLVHTHLGTLDHDAVDDVHLTVEAFQSGEEDPMESIEAAEALLNMDSPSSLNLTLDEKHLSHIFLSDVSTTPVNQMSLLSDGFQGQQWLQLQRDVEVETATQQPKAKKARKPRRRRTGSPIPDIHIKKSKDGRGNTLYLWEFLMALLQDRNACPRYIKWTNREKGIFKLVDSKAVSQLWGKHKNKPDMNYETMGRALRYYYQRGILNKVEGQRLVYQFAELPKDMVYIADDDGDGGGGGGDGDLQHEVDHNDNDEDEEDGDDDSGDSDDDVDNEEPLSDQESSKRAAALTPSRPPRPAAKQPARGAKAPVRRRAVNGGQHAPTPASGASSAGKAGRALGLIQQQHLPIVSAEMLRTLQNVQSLQPGRHGSVFRTAQLLGSLRQRQEGVTAAQGTLGQPRAPAPAPPDAQAESSTPQIVTLQLVPVTSTDTGGTLMATPQLLMQQMASGEQVTLVVESLGGDQSVQSVTEGTPATSLGPATTTLTLVGPAGQQLVSQPPGTVIHSVVTATEPEQYITLSDDDINGENQAGPVAMETTSDAPRDREGGQDFESQPKMKMEPLSVMIINDSWVGFSSSA